MQVAVLLFVFMQWWCSYMDMIKVEHLNKFYGTSDNIIKALDDVSLTIAKGQFVAIVGPSGSGKSSLLHIIGGVDQATSGKVFINELDITKLNSEELAILRRRDLGIIYQFFNLIPVLTVEENIQLPTLLDHQKIDETYFEELISLIGLKPRLKSLPYQLSGGQQQRVAIARALMNKPNILLCDEPTGNLDSANSVEIIQYLKKTNVLYQQTIVLVTHDEDIALMADRIIHLKDGKIVKDEVLRR